MEKEFVPYELAVKLEELGFDKKCIATIDQTNYIHIKGTRRPIRGAMVYNTIDCPTFSQAFRWFREKYNLYHVITIADLGKYESGNPDFQCAIYSKDPVVIRNMDNYKTYEEAELACLDKLIEMTHPNK